MLPEIKSITFVGVPESKDRSSSLWSQLKQQLPAHLKADPTAAADLMYQQMHRMSMKGYSRVKHRHQEEISISEQSLSRGSSQITISALSERPALAAKTYVIFSAEEDDIVDPRYLIEDDLWEDAHVKHTKEQAQLLVDRSRDADARMITAIIKYKEKVIYMMKPLNVANTPESALKVQWRISRYLLAPSFFLVFSMLNRYGPTVALIKRTPNSALCIYETVDLAARVLNMHALNQSNKVLILSWWHPKAASLTNETSLNTLMTSRWLKTVCEGILKMDEPTRGGLQDAIRPLSQHIMGRRSSAQSQHHMSMIKYEIKRALRKYTALRRGDEDFTITAGTMPLLKDSKTATDGGSSQTDPLSKLKSKLIRKSEEPL